MAVISCSADCLFILHQKQDLLSFAWIQVEWAATAAYGWRGELVSHERQAPPNGRLMS